MKEKEKMKKRDLILVRTLGSALLLAVATGFLVYRFLENIPLFATTQFANTGNNLAVAAGVCAGLIAFITLLIIGYLISLLAEN